MRIIWLSNPGTGLQAMHMSALKWFKFLVAIFSFFFFWKFSAWLWICQLTNTDHWILLDEIFIPFTSKVAAMNSYAYVLFNMVLIDRMFFVTELPNHLWEASFISWKIRKCWSCSGNFSTAMESFQAWWSKITFRSFCFMQKMLIAHELLFYAEACMVSSVSQYSLLSINLVLSNRVLYS